MSDRPVTLLIVGAGDRGSGYARIAAELPEPGRVVAVAEPRDTHREQLAAAHGIPAGNVFRDWREAADRPRLADAVIIATQDDMHREPALAFAELGYHMLLEKPMAPNEADCAAIVDGVRRAGILFAVGHVLRYTPYTRRLKQCLDDGMVGDIVSVQHLEPVIYWHQAHSFVRGNWGNTERSSCMLLAKSCHDLDFMRYIVDRPCRRVSSFGSLHHFRPENRPAGAAERCLDCAVETDCPYAAGRMYFGFLERGVTGWPVNVLTPHPTEDRVRQALRDGPYGRCVYACDNDVVDHQVVSMEFEGGRSAVFTMTAFTHHGAGRTTRIFGTRGELVGDSSTVKVHDFLTDRITEIDTNKEPVELGGHGGGDGGLMRHFLRAVRREDPSEILSGPEETLESHRMVFAAERARLTGTIVDLP